MMDKRIAFVFPGQGAQYSGMGKALYEHSPAARAVFDLADRIRPGTSRQCFEGTKEELTQTANTQPCLYCVDLAAAEALREAGVVPAMLAGFSLGEMAALTFSGAVSMEDGFRLVCRRGELMQAAAEKTGGAMMAVLKLDNLVVEEICRRYEAVYPVNYNCPGQLVVAGKKEQLELFKNDIKEAGGRAVPLAVGGGFHSPFMAEASEGFAKELETVTVKKPAIPLYANDTAAPYGEDGKALLANQICHPVRWQETVENMKAAGADIFIETGAGKTLCGLISRTIPDARVYQVEDMETLQSTLKELTEHG